MNGVSKEHSSPATGLHEFVNDLKTAKVFTSKQCLVIENLYIYFRDLKVYKVIVAVNPLMLKKAKKLGLNSQYITTYFDDIKISIPNLSVSSGSYIALYNVNNRTCSVFNGEVSEEEQAAKFKRKKSMKSNGQDTKTRHDDASIKNQRKD